MRSNKSLLMLLAMIGLASLVILGGCEEEQRDASANKETVSTVDASAIIAPVAQVKSCKPGCTKPCCAAKSSCDAVKSCKPGCTKPCCAAKSSCDAVKSCKPGCTKPCCAAKSSCDAVKSCKPGCTKPCCAAKRSCDDAKADSQVKSCKPGCTKPCCAAKSGSQVKSCKPGCTKPCCAGASVQQTTCPIMGGAINKDVFTEYKGKKVYFCCPGCDNKFKEDPEKYISKLPQFGEQK